ncbi:MAG: diguanylate cyclase [Deltaproteobacteria bacterium]|nr:diguanylate cyclase [Deltaproteobacteria bacterium]
MGGDEFLAVLEDTDQKSARHLAERLCAAVDGLNIYADQETKLGVSIGLAELQEDGSTSGTGWKGLTIFFTTPRRRVGHGWL